MDWPCLCRTNPIPGDCGWDPEGGGRLNAEGGGVASDGRIEELDQVKISAFLLA